MIDNNQPALLDKLTTLLDCDTNFFSVARWLKKHRHPLAAHVYEVAGRRLGHPDDGRDSSGTAVLTEAESWGIYYIVGVGIFWALDAHLNFWHREEGFFPPTVPPARGRQLIEEIQRHFEWSRRELIVCAFNWNLCLLWQRYVTLHAENAWLPEPMASLGWDRAVPSLCQLHTQAQDRFRSILTVIWSRRRLHGLGYAVMDCLCPDWRARLKTVVRDDQFLRPNWWESPMASSFLALLDICEPGWQQKLLDLWPGLGSSGAAFVPASVWLGPHQRRWPSGFGCN